MLTRLAHLLTTEVAVLTETEEAVDLIEDGREGIRLLLVHSCPSHKTYVDKSTKKEHN